MCLGFFTALIDLIAMRFTYFSFNAVLHTATFGFAQLWVLGEVTHFGTVNYQ